MADESTTPAPSRAALAFIFVTVLLDVLAMGIIIPVLPNLVAEFLGGDTPKAAQIYGIFGTVWALMQFVVSPILGSLSDRFGRRPIILFSNLGLGLDYVLMALAPSLGWLFVGRVISGITAAGYTTAAAYIADVTPPEKRAAGFGMLGAAFGVGFVLGPALGGLLGAVDLRLPFWGAALLTLLNWAYGVFILPESLPKEKRTPFSWKRSNPLASMKLLGKHPELLGLAAVVWLNSLAHESLPNTFVLYAGYRYGWQEHEVGLTLAVVGICSLIVQGGLIGWAVSKLGERRAAVVGLLFGIASFAIYGLAPTGLWFLVGIPVMALWGFFGPTAQSIMSKRVDSTEQGQLQGSLTALRGIAGLIGPGLFTFVFARGISPQSAIHLPGSAFLLASALLVVALVGCVMLFRRTQTENVDDKG